MAGALIILASLAVIVGVGNWIYRVVKARKRYSYRLENNHSDLLDTMRRIRILCDQHRDIAPELANMIDYEIHTYWKKEIGS